ncbi:MAG: heavy metal translocating P-type ATPase [Deltaproteobacteria bacterium]|nr:MAG: heavy metal translocating P-type ATPase [Deltaproteobacteria bacterium]
MVTADTCIHCKLPIPRGDLVVDEIDGKELHFCCYGCQGVYRIINGAGLGKFYQQRDWHQEGVPDGVFGTAFDDDLLAGHVVTRNETSAEIALIIEGIRCASCVWLLEKLIDKVQGVETVRVNYGTHRAQIRFNPKETTPKEIFTNISRLGYLPHPYTSGAAQRAAVKEQRSLLIRFGTAAFLSMQVMGFSFALYGGYFHGIDPSIRVTIQYFAAAVATPVVFYSGWPFFAGAWRSIRNKAPSMDLLITLGVTTAYSYSIYSMLAGGEVYFDTAAMIITLILLGRLFEGSARNRSISGIDKLLRLAPESANLMAGEHIQVVASTSLKPGDLILVRPGERIPVDGLIHGGKTELDEATISGEPMPVLKQQGDTVLAGTLNLSSSIQLRVERVAAESFIARMALMVEEAQNRKAPIQSLADKVATLFVPFVTLTAAGTWLFWFLNDVQSNAALLNAVSVLIVACPCALGLATPTAVLVASGNAATRGILFRGGDILEMTARIGTIAFDKTGTLTLGKPTVEKIIPAPGQSEESLLRIASQVENGSSHPIARGIVARAKVAGIHIGTTNSVETVPGRGLRMVGSEGEILVGSLAFLEECNIEIPFVESGSLTEVYVSLAGHWIGTLLIVDPLREEADSAVGQLQQSGLRTVLLTGDRLAAAQEVSSKLAISDFHTNLNPADKTEWIRSHQEAGEKIMMVGDGINDAPALSLADVGCAMAGGTDIALETSDLVLTRANLGRVYEAVYIARKTLVVIKQNLFWAFAYNLITIPLAASGNLAPVWAALTMASSSVIVVGNSLRLGRVIRRTFSVAKARASN